MNAKEAKRSGLTVQEAKERGVVLTAKEAAELEEQNPVCHAQKVATPMNNENEPIRKNTDLNTGSEAFLVEHEGLKHNFFGITGDPLTPEQVAEINSAVSSLTPEQQKRVTEIVGAWLHTHHGQDLPNVKEIAKAVKHGGIQ